MRIQILCVRMNIKICIQTLVYEYANIANITKRQNSRRAEKFINQFRRKLQKYKLQKGFYVYGSPGCGKTHFVSQILKELNYDIIKYDAGDVRNKSLIDTITSDNMGTQNVLHMMTKTRRKIAIIMDEIDGMNNGDKGGLIHSSN